MARCIACNRPLLGGTALATHPLTGEPEDMCSRCQDASKSKYNYTYDHEFIQPVGNDVPESKSNYFYEYYDNF